MPNIHQKLVTIQNELVATKSEYNSFGKYKYRTAESILQAVKPVCKKHGCYVILSETLELIGSRYYVKATATLVDAEAAVGDLNNESTVNLVSVSSTSFAREEESKKGMDGSQMTGASTSYARKYALTGLFAIDNEDDADKLNVNDEYTQQAQPQPQQAPQQNNMRDVTPYPNQIGYQNQQSIPQNGYQGQPQAYQQAPQGGFEAQQPQGQTIPMKSLDDKRFNDAMAKVRSGIFPKSRLMNEFMLTQNQWAEIEAYQPPPHYPQ